MTGLVVRLLVDHAFLLAGIVRLARCQLGGLGLVGFAGHPRCVVGVLLSSVLVVDGVAGLVAEIVVKASVLPLQCSYLIRVQHVVRHVGDLGF